MSSELAAAGLDGKIAVVTGGGGAICGAMAKALAASGVAVAVWDRSTTAAQTVTEAIAGRGGRAVAMTCDVLKPDDVERAMRDTVAAFGTIDILINGAGGSRKEATTSADLSFFDIGADALLQTLALNYAGLVIPSQAVGRRFAQQHAGVVLNIASIAGMRPLTRSVGYCNGKAAAISFTQWLAVHMAQTYSPQIRVNAIAPGFVLTGQNRFLLTDERTGEPTERGRQIIRSTPMGRYGTPEDMVGAALWLVSDSARFVTGAVIPVDGGFTAFAGV